MTISTHVLDTERGRPAAGVRVELYRGDELVGSGETDGDGRIRDAKTIAALLMFERFHMGEK